MSLSVPKRSSPKPVEPRFSPDGTSWSRMLKALGANSLGQAIHFAYRLLLPPLCLRSWGQDAYGDWLALSSLAFYLSLADLGGRFYMANRLTQTITTDSTGRFQALLQTSLVIYTIVSALIGLLCLGVVALVGPNSLLNLSAIPPSSAMAVLGLLAVQHILS